jgi:outer membrane protein TolC
MRTAFESAKVWISALAIATPVAAWAQTPSAAQTPAAPQTPQVDRYVVGQARPPENPAMPTVDMTLEQAIERALERNLELKSARLQPRTLDFQLRSIRASYTPTFTSSYSYSNAARRSENTLEGVDRVTTVDQGYNGRWQQTLPWYGSNYSIAFNNGRTADNTVTRRINPSYNSSIAFSFSMPVWQGFKIDQNRNRLQTLPIQRNVEDLRLQIQIENLKNSIRIAYWSLRSAIEQIEIQRQALALAQRTLNENRIRIQIGTMAPIETVQQEAAIATTEQQLLQAEITFTNAELNLKRLLVDAPDDELFRRTINPIDLPEIGAPSVDIPEAIQLAMSSRLDVTQARRNLDVSKMNLVVTKEALKPSLALSTGYTARGTGGRSATDLDGGYWDALSQIGQFATPTWSISMNFTYPLGMQAAKANYASALLGIEQQEITLKAQELSITTEVTDAGLAVENAYKSLQASQKSRQASERNEQAARTRFDVGMATNFEVVQAQQQLTVARLSELSRTIAYLNALANYEKVQRISR